MEEDVQDETKRRNQKKRLERKIRGIENDKTLQKKVIKL